MRSVLRLLAVLVAVGLAALWFLLPSSQTGSSAVAPTPLVPAAASPARPDAIRSGGADIASSAPRAEAEVPEVAAVLPQEPVPQGEPLIVHVRNGESGLAIEGATVRYATQQQMRDARDGRSEGRSTDLEQALERIGKAELTDANGEVRLPRLGERMRVSARHGELYTHTLLRGDEQEPIVIDLFLDRTVEIQVVDPAGRFRGGVPVGVSVAQARENDSVWRGETREEDGIATLFHAQVELADAFQRGKVQAELLIPMQVAAAEDPLVVPQVSFDDKPWPNRPLRLVLPPTGSVTVRLLDEKGEPYLQRARIDLTLVERQPEVVERQRMTRNFNKEADNGSATFPCVGLDLELRVSARPFDELRPVSDNVTGPVRSGQVVDVPLRFEQRWPVLLGRLIDEGGLAVAARSVSVRVNTGGNQRAMQNFESDAEGRFRCPIEARGNLTGPLTLEFLADPSSTPSSTDVARACTREVVGLPAEDVDLRDVKLEPAGLIAAGVVLDGADTPIEGANVQAQFGSADPRGRMRWDRARSALAATSGADGRFEVRGIAQPDELRLVASKRGWNDEGPVGARLGSDEVVLRLAKSGSLSGTVMLNPGVEPNLFQVRASWSQFEASGEELRRNAGTRVENDGTFTINEVAPGQVNVEIALSGSGRRLELIEGVFVTSGEATRDVRLNPIDLSDDVFVYKIGVLDGAGNPVEAGYVATNERTRNSRMAYAIREGSASVMAFQRAVDLEISAPGHTTLFLPGVDSDREVILDPAFSVTLHLADHVPLPRSPIVLQAKLTPNTGNRRNDAIQIFEGGQAVGWSNPWIMGTENTFGLSREITVLVTQPGRQRLSFVLTIPGQGIERNHNIPPVPGLEITTTADNAGTTYNVAPHGEYYEQALREMGGL